MTFFWHNGRRIKVRGRDSMQGLVGSVDEDVLKPIVGSIVRKGNNKTKHRGKPSPKKKHIPKVVCVDRVKREVLLHSNTKHQRNMPESSFKNCSLFDECGYGFDNIQVFLDDVDTRFHSLCEAFHDSDEQLAQAEPPEPAKSVTFFTESISASECCCYDWVRIPEQILTRPPSYTGTNQYHIDPHVIEKRLNKVLNDADNDSDDSSSIEGDDTDSETESKHSYDKKISNITKSNDM